MHDALTQITIHVEPEEHDRLKEEADREGVSVAAMVRVHLRRSRRQTELLREVQAAILTKAS